MWELDCKKAEHWRTDAFELWCHEYSQESLGLQSFDLKEIKPVNPKVNQSWIFIRRTDAEAETPILWPPDAKNWLFGKDPDAGKGWRKEEKGTTEDEMDGWMASPTYWTWIWTSSRGWWWTGKPGVLQSISSQRIRNNWETELKCILHKWKHFIHWQ